MLFCAWAFCPSYFPEQERYHKCCNLKLGGDDYHHHHHHHHPNENEASWPVRAGTYHLVKIVVYHGPGGRWGPGPWWWSHERQIVIGHKRWIKSSGSHHHSALCDAWLFHCDCNCHFSCCESCHCGRYSGRACLFMFVSTIIMFLQSLRSCQSWQQWLVWSLQLYD